MGAVYEARGTEGEVVAVKVMLATSRRFVREAKSVMALDHDHVVRVFDAGVDDDMNYLVMEKLHGSDLGALIARRGPIEPEAVATIFVQACLGVQAAHDRELVHRDIKPSNLFVHELESGEVVLKVCDFGIAKDVGPGAAYDTTASDLTRSDGVLGSPLYMSPEQARNAKRVDARSDLWSLGVSLYQALSGTLPWRRRETVGEILLAICTEPLVHLQDAAPWIDRGLAEAVHRALERDPARRFQSAGAMAEALRPFATAAIHVDGLCEVSSEVRATVAERAQDIDSVTMDAVAATPPTFARPRRRGAVIAIAAGAAIAALALQRFVATAPLSSALSMPIPSVVVSATPTAAPLLRGVLAIEPADAQVSVDGRAVEGHDGKVVLEGEPGDAFDVVVEHGGQRVQRSVVMTKNGGLAPSSLALVRPVRVRTIAKPRATSVVSAAPRDEKPKPKEDW